MGTAFAERLKDWRGRRRMSQLDLSLTADVSARHVAFLETGRSQPSREMVLRLADALDVPLVERNALLAAAGFAARYPQRPLDDPAMAQVGAAVAWMLERHEPFPAFAVDRHWRVVRANTTATLMLQSAGVAIGDSLLAAAVETEAFRARVENWPEVAAHMATRLRTESAHLGGDPVLDAAASALDRQAGDRTESLTTAGTSVQPVIATRYRWGDATLSFFTTIAQFGAPEDIAIADLKIELMFPADDETRAAILALKPD